MNGSHSAAIEKLPADCLARILCFDASGLHRVFQLSEVSRAFRRATQNIPLSLRLTTLLSDSELDWLIVRLPCVRSIVLMSKFDSRAFGGSGGGGAEPSVTGEAFVRLLKRQQRERQAAAGASSSAAAAAAAALSLPSIRTLVRTR